MTDSLIQTTVAADGVTMAVPNLHKLRVHDNETGRVTLRAAHNETELTFVLDPETARHLAERLAACAESAARYSE